MLAPTSECGRWLDHVDAVRFHERFRLVEHLAEARAKTLLAQEELVAEGIDWSQEELVPPVDQLLATGIAESLAQSLVDRQSQLEREAQELHQLKQEHLAKLWAKEREHLAQLAEEEAHIARQENVMAPNQLVLDPAVARPKSLKRTRDNVHHTASDGVSDGGVSQQLRG